MRTAFRRRAMEALEGAAKAATPEALANALSAPTGAGAAARLLADAAASGAAAELEPLVDAVARGAAARERLIRHSGGLLTATQMGAALGGISRQAVNKRRRAAQLLAVRIGSDWRYPAIQVAPDGTVPAEISNVVRAMADAGPWATLDFLLASDSVLGGLRTIDALQQGGAAADAVRRLMAASAVDSYS